MDKVLSIRIPEEMAAALAAREERADIPTSNYVRRLIKNGLDAEAEAAAPVDYARSFTHTRPAPTVPPPTRRPAVLISKADQFQQVNAAEVEE